MVIWRGLNMNLIQAKRNLKFADYIEKEIPDDKFDMFCWFKDTKPTCGSTACLAGHAVLWPPYARLISKLYKAKKQPLPELTYRADMLAEIMGDNNVARLFYMCHSTKNKVLHLFRNLVYAHFPELKSDKHKKTKLKIKKRKQSCAA